MSVGKRGDRHVPVVVLPALEVDHLFGAVRSVTVGRALIAPKVEDIRRKRGPHEPVGRFGSVEKAHLEGDQSLLAEIDRLLDGARLPVPEVEPLAVVPRPDVLEIEPG